MSFPETKLWKILVEVCLRLGIAQMTPCVQLALVLSYSCPPKSLLEVELGLSGQYSVSLS